MRRRQLFQFSEQMWLPKALRQSLARFLDSPHDVVQSSTAFAPLIDSVCDAAGTTHVVDLSSGAARVFLSLVRSLRGCSAKSWSVVLSDPYPDRDAADQIARGGDAELHYELAPTDATCVPEDLNGVRTFVSRFHRLPPAQARAALRDAFDKHQGICVLEWSRNSVLGLATAALFSLLLPLVAPFLRPINKWQFVWTYLLPIVPAMALWDLLVMQLRTYSRAEYEAMTAALTGTDYSWRVETVALRGVPYAVDCFIGLPLAATAQRSA